MKGLAIKKKKKLSLTTEKRKFLSTIQRAVVYEEASENGICTCISCGRRGPISEFDGGHGFAKGASLKMSRVRKNIHAQCHYCNRIIPGGNQIYWFEGVKQRYGLEEYQYLMDMDAACKGNEEARANLPAEDVYHYIDQKWSALDYKEEREKYEQIIKENKYKEGK